MSNQNDRQEPSIAAMDRRTFLKTSLAGVAAATMTKFTVDAVAADKKKPVTLNLCSQEGRIPGANLKEKIANLEAWGAAGIEFGGDAAGRIKEIKDTLKGSKLRMAAICWGAHGGDLVSMDMDKRKKGIQDLKDILAVAGELESTGVIYVPCFNNESKLTKEEVRKIMIDILPDIGDHAQKCKSRLLIEPLNRGETYVIRTLAEGASICNELKNPGICMMGDFYHMCIEEKSDKDAFVTAGPLLHHVHLASRQRNLPGQDDRSFVDGFRGLKQIGYQDFCSLECGCIGKPEEEIPKAFRFLEKQWAEATI